MHVTFFSQQVGRLGGKRIDFHPWGLKINPQEWHGCCQCWNVDQIFSTYMDNIG